MTVSPDLSGRGLALSLGKKSQSEYAEHAMALLNSAAAAMRLSQAVPRLLAIAPNSVARASLLRSACQDCIEQNFCDDPRFLGWVCASRYKRFDGLFYA
jgi:hypothetical protein